MRGLCLFIGMLTVPLFSGEFCSAGLITDARLLDGPTIEIVAAETRTTPPAVSSANPDRFELSPASLGSQLSPAIVAPTVARLERLTILAIAVRQRVAIVPPYWTPPDRPA